MLQILQEVLSDLDTTRNFICDISVSATLFFYLLFVSNKIFKRLMYFGLQDYSFQENSHFVDKHIACNPYQ